MGGLEPFRRSSRPRVCVLSAHHVGGHCLPLAGGAEKYARAVVRALLEHRASVVAAFSGDDIYEDLSPNDHLARIRTDWLDADLGGDRRLRPSLIRERMRWFSRLKPDAVFAVQQGHGHAFGASLVAARLTGARVVASIRQPAMPAPSAPAQDRWRLGLWRHRLLWRSRLIARACHALIFNSVAVRRDYVNGWGWPMRGTFVIPNGVETAPENPRRRAGPVRFGVVGRLAPHKGPDLAVAALRRLIEGGHDVAMELWGEGPLREELSRQVSDLPIRLPGHSADHERIFADLDVLLCPSRREASSNSVLEAMARGIACIVSNVGGLPELVAHGKAGMVVPVSNVHALAEAMHALVIDDAHRRALGQAGRALAQREHDLARRMRETVNVILGRPRACAAPPGSEGRATLDRVPQDGLVGVLDL